MMGGLVMWRLVRPAYAFKTAQMGYHNSMTSQWSFAPLLMTGFGSLSALLLLPELPFVGALASAVNAPVSAAILGLKKPPRKRVVWEDVED